MAYPVRGPMPQLQTPPSRWHKRRDTLERMAARKDGAAHPYVAAWLAVFDQGLEATSGAYGVMA